MRGAGKQRGDGGHALAQLPWAGQGLQRSARCSTVHHAVQARCSSWACRRPPPQLPLSACRGCTTPRTRGIAPTWANTNVEFAPFAIPLELVGHQGARATDFMHACCACRHAAAPMAARAPGLQPASLLAPPHATRARVAQTHEAYAPRGMSPHFSHESHTFRVKTHVTWVASHKSRAPSAAPPHHRAPRATPIPRVTINLMFLDHGSCHARTRGRPASSLCCARSSSTHDPNHM